jgi:hypothetical protein
MAARWRYLADSVLVMALVGATLWRLLPAVDATRFHRDEARWIGDAALVREWRHPFGGRWQDEGYENRYGTIDESNRRRNQPPLALYAIGLGLMLHGEGLPKIGYWIMTQDTDWNTEQGNLPSRAELRAGRQTSVAIAVLTVICLYALGAQLTNRVGGSVAALLYAVHPLVRDTSTRAWSDPLLVLCIALAALAAVRLCDRPTWGRAAALGIVFGLGAATKLSPLPVAGALGIIGFAFWGSGRLLSTVVPSRIGRLGERLMVVPVVALITLIAVYPYLWRNPAVHLHRLFAFRADSFEQQSVNSPDAAVPTRGDAFRRVGVELGDHFSTSGLIADKLERVIGTEIPASIDYLDLVVAVLGILLLTGMMIRSGPASPASALNAVIGGHVLLILMTIGVEYPRYFLPVALYVGVLVGVVGGMAWSWIPSAVTGRRPEHGEELDIPPGASSADAVAATETGSPAGC